MRFENKRGAKRKEKKKKNMFSQVGKLIFLLVIFSLLE
jgi:hypothetical protein